MKIKLGLICLELALDGEDGGLLLVYMVAVWPMLTK